MNLCWLSFNADVLVAPTDETATAWLRSPSYPGKHIKLTAEGEKWARERMAKGSQFVQDWKLETVNGRS